MKLAKCVVERTTRRGRAVKMFFISVCKNTVAYNLKHGRNEPVIRVCRGKHGKPRRVHQFHADGHVVVRYEPNNPMPWGARAWVEVHGEES